MILLKTILLFFSFLVPLKAEIEDIRINAYNFTNDFNISNELYNIPKFEIKVSTEFDESRYFNKYLLKAVTELNKKYALKGYDIHAALTHNIKYNDQGEIKALKPPYTMCVAAQLEIILTAYEIYAKETKDYSVYTYLPKSSYENLTSSDIRGHIWVNHDFNSYGTADALINFGMGERVKFEDLKPGSFVNINRTNGTGHAVLFIGFIDKSGKLLNEYSNKVIGFRYYSSQGLKEEGKGGLDYRNAIFSKYGCPDMDFKRDCDVIYSEDQRFLNTGMMLSPNIWKMPKPTWNLNLPPTVLDEKKFDGSVTDY
ncbi:MAG TPA: hypothetical protein PK103_08530 [Elusimicrobiales bacterium]|nr:hypothetical protein [Elusimicrobiales bacterium]HOL63393.1 hypothetical protein [Elusimicrobiales bacterium]HPO95854.1 hypothetical protein [Elusimicrobiales bacterium]